MKSYWFVIRNPQLSFYFDRRTPALVLAITALLLVVIILSIGQGEYPISPVDVVKTILGINTGNPDHAFVIYTLRLPRTLTALLVGMALAIAGTITQAILRNPLAAPGIIGVNSGAALAAVALLVVFPGVSVAVLPAIAFVGGFLTFVLIYLFGWKGGSSPVRLILVGIGFNLIAATLTNILITFGEINSVSAALTWLAGSVYGSSWQKVSSLLPWLMVFCPIVWLMARDLNAFNLGDAIARGLGNPVEWRRGLLLTLSVALSGAAVATAGSIGFVDFVTPHIARKLVGPSHQGLLPVAALAGGLLMVLSDLVGRILFAPIEIPCGLITSVLGAIYFLYLITHRPQSR
jgi:iron complex transport system permease protein